MVDAQFYRLSIVDLFEHKDANKELLQSILNSFFSSLVPGPVKLETLDRIRLLDDGNLEIVIHGFYSAHPTKYVVVVNEKMKTEKLLVY